MMLLRRIRVTLGFPLLLVVATMLAACDGGTPSIGNFEDQWYNAINSRQYEQLYEMLDASSRRHYRQQLQKLRGLEEAPRQYVIDQLGGERVKSLNDLTAAQYFACLWHRATSGQRPKMSIEARGRRNGYMLLWHDEQQKLRVRLFIEGDRWVWQSPHLELTDDPSAPPFG